MKISNGTIDCWLYAVGKDKVGDYSDFQHHHWDIGPSPRAIDHQLLNDPPYTWTLNASGHDDGGSWSTINQSTPALLAEVWIDSSNTVTLTQKASPGVNHLPSIGIPQNTENHVVSELIWKDQPMGFSGPTWSPLTSTPSSIIQEDPGRPHYEIVIAREIQLPSGGKKSLRRLAVVSGVGGRPFDTIATGWQTPSGTHFTAWWSWRINLI
jgi:hypothetical protein